MQIDESQIKSFLLDSNLISKKEIEEATREAKDRNLSFKDILLSRGSLSEDDLRRVQAFILGIPFVDLKKERLDFEILSFVPEPIARNRNIVAFRKGSDSLEVALLDIEDLEALDFIQEKNGLKILPRLTDGESMKFALVAYQSGLRREFGDILERETAGLKAYTGKETESELKKLSKDKSVVSIVDTLLKHAYVQGATDIHIEPEENQVLIRYRLGGSMEDSMVLPKAALLGLTARLKDLSDLSLVEKKLPQDGRFKIDMNGEKVSFRVSTMPVFHGEKITMRVLKENAIGFTLEGLGFYGQALADIHQTLKSSSGLVLAVGPSSSGKTTVLYTLIDILNRPSVNISTIEDPIEFQMKRINQTQVRPEIGFTYANGLRALVRQDPDIIMVGEIRDKQTAEIAANSAQTGHLVLSSLYARSAAESVAGLLEMKMEPFLLSSALDSVISCRLIRKLDENKQAYFLNKEEIRSLGSLVSLDKMMDILKSENLVERDATWDKVPFYKPRAGQNEDGFDGFVGLYEVMRINQSMKGLITKNEPDLVDVLERAARQNGMVSMIEDGIFKAVLGVTTIEEVLQALSV